MACMQSYTIRSVKGSETVQTSDVVTAIEHGVHHDMRLQPMGGTTVEDAQGETVAEVRCGADLQMPGGIVVELADGTEVDLSATESGRESRALLRAALAGEGR